MMYATGTYDRIHGSYRMHAPEFPYDSTLFIGYSLEGMKRAYRAKFGLKGRRIEWIILGID